MASDQYITLGPEHIAPFGPSIITAFAERWFVGRLNGRLACGFVREDIGKRLYLVDGHLVLECEAERRARWEAPQQPVSPLIQV